MNLQTFLWLVSTTQLCFFYNEYLLKLEIFGNLISLGWNSRKMDLKWHKYPNLTLFNCTIKT